jgi:hypothetical protein
VSVCVCVASEWEWLCQAVVVWKVREWYRRRRRRLKAGKTWVLSSCAHAYDNFHPCLPDCGPALLPLPEWRKIE